MPAFLVCDLNRTPIVMANHGGFCVHFSGISPGGISTCGRTSRQTVSHPRRPPLLTLYKISLPVCVIVTNKRLRPLTTSIIHWCYLFHCWKSNNVWLNTGVSCAPCIVEGSALSFAEGAAEVIITTSSIYMTRRASRFMQWCVTHTHTHTHENLTKQNIKKKLC